MAIDSLWGEIPDIPSIRPPALVLKEQGELLERLTKGLLIARVTRDQDGSSTILRLMIIAPALNNYRHVLLTVLHGIELFPVDVIDDADHSSRLCSSEAELLERLKEIFQSDRTKRVIAGLLAQIQMDS